jgi:hypothetical protein
MWPVVLGVVAVRRAKSLRKSNYIISALQNDTHIMGTHMYISVISYILTALFAKCCIQRRQQHVQAPHVATVSSLCSIYRNLQ